MDVYYPANFQGGSWLPAVIFIHGDADPEFIKNAKDWGQYTGWGQLTAATGLVAITFNHRSSYELTRLFDVVGGIEELVQYVRNNAEGLGIDKDALCIWACSAGVPYGVRVALHNPPAYVKCSVLYYGFMGIDQILPDDAPDMKSMGQEFSGQYYVQAHAKDIAPVLIARAGLDYPEINTTIDAFVAEALSRNMMLTVMNHPDGRHAFDVLDDVPRSREIIKATLEFMKTHLLLS
jgi:dienelactone hydrolase